MRDPRSPLLRVSFKVVENLYRTPARGVLGLLYLVITHRGRKTGRVHQTVVTILHRDRSNDEIFVTSSMQGEKADWYRNLTVAPPLRIQVGSNSFEVTQRHLSLDERKDFYRRVCRLRPVRARIGLLVTGHKWPRSDSDFGILAAEMPAICFTRRDD